MGVVVAISNATPFAQGSGTCHPSLFCIRAHLALAWRGLLQERPLIFFRIFSIALGTVVSRRLEQAAFEFVQGRPVCGRKVPCPTPAFYESVVSLRLF